jgi:hypothetical protein
LRRIVILLFLVFYFASSYAISQERIRLIVSEVQHSTSLGGQMQVDDGSNQLPDAFPNYRQAKPKTTCVLDFGLTPQPDLPPRVSERSFDIHSTTSFASLYRGENVLSRAPPSQS